MNRRTFAKSILQSTAGTVAASAFPRTALSTPQSNPAAVPFRFSVMLWSVFGNLPFDQRLEKIAEAGYTNVELTGEFFKWSDDDYLRFNAKKKELGIAFDATSGVRTGIADPAAGDKLIAELKNMLATAARLDCSTIILLSGNRIDGLSHDAQHAACIENLTRAADLAAEHNVSLIVENIDPEENPKYYLTSVAEGFDIVRKVNRPNVKFLYDFYHEQIAEGNLIEKLRKNIDLTAVVHIADVPGRHEPGTGEINYPNIFRTLAELNFKGIVAMEFRPTGDPVTALRTARDLAIRSASAVPSPS